MLPFLILSLTCTADPIDTTKKSWDSFHEKIPARREAIAKDLKAGKHELWEGAFDDGWLFAGLKRSFTISRKEGYVSNSRLIGMGRVKAAGNRIVLHSEAPEDSVMPLEYVVVPWEDQVFLVEPAALIAFCNDDNSGDLRHNVPMGGSRLLRVKDFARKRPSGDPIVPAEYKEYILSKPIAGSILRIGEEKEDVAVRGRDDLIRGISLILNVGKKEGVRSGMRFYAERNDSDIGGSRFFVISTNESQCELLQCVDKGRGGCKIGMRLTTADPYFNAK